MYLVTDGVFSADPQDAARAEFHPATNLDAAKVKAVANQMRHRGLERLARYCARPALAAGRLGRLGRLNDDLLVYRLRRPAGPVTWPAMNQTTEFPDGGQAGGDPAEDRGNLFGKVLGHVRLGYCP